MWWNHFWRRIKVFQDVLWELQTDFDITSLKYPFLVVSASKTWIQVYILSGQEWQKKDTYKNDTLQIYSLSTVIPFYCLHSITAPSTVKNCKHWFTLVYCNIYSSTLLCVRQILVNFTLFYGCPSFQWFPLHVQGVLALCKFHYCEFHYCEIQKIP